MDRNECEGADAIYAATLELLATILGEPIFRLFEGFVSQCTLLLNYQVTTTIAIRERLAHTGKRILTRECYVHPFSVSLETGEKTRKKLKKYSVLQSVSWIHERKIVSRTS